MHSVKESGIYKYAQQIASSLPDIKTFSCIYLLRDPKTNEVRYVGQARDPKHRYMNHLWDKQQKEKSEWVASLLAVGKHPLFEIIEEAERHNVTERENFYILFYRKKGQRLFNKPRIGKGHRIMYPHLWE